MVRAELRALHSPDLLEMQSMVPEDPRHFLILVQAFIGPFGERGEESFNFLVCTPSWILTRLEKDKFLWGRHYLVVERYDYNTIWRVIEKLCTTTQGPDWISVATRLGRYGHWEFEDFRNEAESS